MNIEEKVIQKIKQEHLQPKSIWFFLVKDYSLWGLVFLSIVLAAMSIAPIIFIIENIEPEYIKHISKNIYWFILIMLPYPWLIMCTITTFLATMAWEKTKHGYRFNGKYIFISAFLSSLILGIILNIWQFGRAMDDEFRYVSFGRYKSFEQRRDENWFNPEQGRVVGIIKGISTSSFLIVNHNNNFQENVSFDFSIPGIQYLELDNKLRVIGFNNENGNFIACSIFPDNLLPPKQRAENRNEIKQKMQQIFETYPECKEMFDLGRANYQPKIFLKQK